MKHCAIWLTFSFSQAGHPTLRTQRPGEPLEEGFYHGLGHGVGLRVHEPPMLNYAETGTLLAGDVITIEPGIYRPGFGGCRLEDILIVTDDGAELLTAFPYELTSVP
jgi:Xaa-Pro aminopeptidase